jgi:olefin beta-lactone synthetase
MATIGELLTRQAETQPEALAIVDARGGRERRVTYAGLEGAVARAAADLAARGLGPGRAVLVFVPMSLELYVALLALFRLGAVALFLDPSAGRAHLERCCARRPPAALLAIPKAHLLRLTSGALRRIPLKLTVGGWVPGAARFSVETGGAATRPVRGLGPVQVGPGDAALVTFTSGSTGVPKAAVRTHGFLVAQHRVLAPRIALEAGDVDLATLPVFTLANLASGITTVIADIDLRRPGAVEAADVAAAIHRYSVNRITASPAFFERLVDHAGRAGEETLTLRQLHTGGAPVFPRLLTALRAWAPNAQVVAVYGSTEAEPIAHLTVEAISPADVLAMQTGRGLLAGLPVPEIDLRILRDRWGTPRGTPTAAEFENDCLPAGQTGEIVVAGEHVLPGYLGGVGDEETKFTVAGRVWHRTGDAGLIDEQGRLWLVGRCAAKISDPYGSLYPFTVECVAMTFPEVRRAAVVAHHGRRLLAFEGPVEVIDALRRATAWARIAEIRVFERLPVDARHNAKIDYPALRRLLET